MAKNYTHIVTGKIETKFEKLKGLILRNLRQKISNKV